MGPRLRLKKALSQHLLVDENILRKMVRVSGVGKEDCIVEIGAGTGSLTRFLAEKAGLVYAIEIDEEFRPFLDPLCRQFENLKIIYGDFLAIPLACLSSPRPVKVIGNIPYGITGPILVKLVKERMYLESAFLTVQKEVGMRIRAIPRTKEYGSLSVVCQTFFDIERCYRLKPHIFVPSPSVESLFISMRRRDEPDLDDGFLSFVRSCFERRRKFMRQALLRRFDEATVERLYKLFGFPTSIRAEEVDPKVFKEMYLFLKSLQSEKVL